MLNVTLKWPNPDKIKTNRQRPNYLFAIYDKMAAASNDVAKDKTAFDIKNHVASIQDFFKCANCGILPRPGIKQCMSCNQVSCNKCDLECGHYKTRNSLAENLFKNLPFPCHNYEYGCREFFMPCDLVAHEEKCVDFRPISCSDCDEKLGFVNFLEHYKQDSCSSYILSNILYRSKSMSPHRNALFSMLF